MPALDVPPRPAMRRSGFAIGMAALLALGALVASAPVALALDCTPGADPAAPGIPLPGSCFEGDDGDQVDGDGGGPGNNHLDWQSVIGSAYRATDNAVGGSDTQFGPGSSEETPDSWTFDFGSLGSDKYDIIRGFVAQEPDTGSDLILELAFMRSSNNGTTHLAFELNQKQPGYRLATETHSPTIPPRQIPVPTRTPGDLLITYSVDPPVIGLCTWSGNEHTGHWLTWTDSTIAGVDCPVLPAKLAQGQMNAATITGANNFLLAPNAPSLDSKTFAEATINVTEVLKGSAPAEGTPDPCVSFGSFLLHSRSSVSITSIPQDYILPADPIHVANCSVSGTKWNDRDGNGLVNGTDAGLGGWAIFVDYDNDGILDNNKDATYVNDNDGVVEAGEEEPFDVTAPSSAGDVRPPGTYSIGDVQNGTWNVREVGQTNWTCTAPNVPDADSGNPPPACAYGITMTGAPIIDRDFLNHASDAVITITKDVEPDSEQDFAFTTTGTGMSDFSLDDDADVTLSNTEVIAIPAAEAGQKSITEVGQTGWTLADLTCSGVPITFSNSTAAGIPRTATFTVTSGDAVTCTYTNRQDATVTVTKTASPADGTDFDFSGDLGAFQLDSGGAVDAVNTTESFTIPGNQAGTKTITEAPEADWALTDVACPGSLSATPDLATQSVNVLVNPGDTIACTFTNTRSATVTVTKQLSPAADPGRFDIRVGTHLVIDDGGNGATGSVSVSAGSYAIVESAANTNLGFYAVTITCRRGTTVIASANGATLPALTVVPGDSVACVVRNARTLHVGTIGAWRNWRNQFSPSAFNGLLSWVATHNTTIYGQPGNVVNVARIDAIYTFGKKTSDSQQLLAQLTGLKLNLAASALGVAKEGSVCSAGVVFVGGISGATTLFGSGTPTIGQVVALVESRWTGTLTTSSSSWLFSLSKAQTATATAVIDSINSGAIILSTGCP